MSRKTSKDAIDKWEEDSAGLEAVVIDARERTSQMPAMARDKALAFIEKHKTQRFERPAKVAAKAKSHGVLAWLRRGWKVA